MKSLRISRPSTWLSAIGERLKGRPDSEHEQAIVRVVIVALLALYFWVLRDAAEGDPAGMRSALLCAVAYLVLSVGYVAMIIAWPQKCVPRRLAAIATDNGTISALMYFGGELGSPFYLLYLWV